MFVTVKNETVNHLMQNFPAPYFTQCYGNLKSSISQLYYIVHKPWGKNSEIKNIGQHFKHCYLHNAEKKKQLMSN